MDLRGLTGICTTLGVAEEDDNGDRIGYSPSETCSGNLLIVFLDEHFCLFFVTAIEIFNFWQRI